MIYLTQFQLSYIMIGFHNLKNTGGNYEKQNYMESVNLITLP